MTPRPTRVSHPRRERDTAAELTILSDRLEAAERRQRQLQHALTAIGREVGISLGCPCGRCEESYTLIRNGAMYCPRCGHQQSL